MAHAPCLYRCDLAIGQKRHNLTSFKVAYNRSVAMVAPESPIVDANHGQRLGSWKGSTPHYGQAVSLLTGGTRRLAKSAAGLPPSAKPR